MASKFDQHNPFNGNSESSELHLGRKKTLQAPMQAFARLSPRQRGLSAGALLFLLAWIWLGYDANESALPTTQQTLALPANPVEKAPIKIAQPESVAPPVTTTNKLAPAPIADNRFENKSSRLIDANNKAVDLALQGQTEQALLTLEQALSSDPSASAAFNNLRRLYAGLASQSYQLALDPSKSKSILVDLTSSDRQVRVELSGPKPINDSLKKSLVPNIELNPSLAITPVPAPAVAVTATQWVENAEAPSTQLPAEPLASVEPLAEPRLIAEPQAYVAPQEVVSPAMQKQAIQTAVNNWASFWAKQDVKGYFASYSPNYAPPKTTRKAWLETRQQKILAPNRISIELSSVSIQLQSPTSAKVSFTQDYRSDNFQSRNQKQLQFELTNQSWLITSESGR